MSSVVIDTVACALKQLERPVRAPSLAELQPIIRRKGHPIEEQIRLTNENEYTIVRKNCVQKP